MNWTIVRGLTYVAGLIASALAFFGFVDFNPATGHLVIHPFNLYGAIAAVAGAVSSALAYIALLRGWGRNVRR